MRNYIIPCGDCELEFDGTEDGPKAYVYFCPLHRNAGFMREALRSEARVQAKMARLYRADARVFTSAGKSVRAIDANVIAHVHRTTFRSLLSLLKFSPSAPVGASLAGAPVATGAQSSEGAAKQS